MKWVTRERVKVDRVACPWLLKKFIDPDAQFLFVPPEQVMEIAVRTRETDFTDAKNFFVARVKRDFFKQSYVGGIYTEGNPERSSSSRTFGGDMRLFTSRFLGNDRNFGVDGFVLKTANKDMIGKDHSYGFGVTCPNDLWSASASWKRVGENFQPALGNLQCHWRSRLCGIVSFR